MIVGVAKLGRWMTALLLGCLLAGSSAAELVERDLGVTGDGAVTFDSLTGLEWLDLTRTTDLSYADITQGFGNTWVSDGWRYATSSEICALFDAYGAIPTPCPRFGYLVTEAPTQTVLAMQALFGVPDVLGPGQQRSGGFFDDGAGNGLIGWASITQHYYEAKDGFEAELDDISLDDAGPLWGNFLVRYVPEPSAALLQSVALLGVALVSRRATARGDSRRCTPADRPECADDPIACRDEERLCARRS